MSTRTAAAPSAHVAVQWRSVGGFYVLASALAWTVDAPLWLTGAGLASPIAPLLIALSAYAPLTAAAVTVRIAEKVPVRQLPRRLGWTAVRPVRRTVSFGIVGLCGSTLLPVVTTLLCAAVGLSQLDVVHFSGFAAVLRASDSSAVATLVPIPVLAVVQLAGMPFAAVPNAALTVGEETGWRGYLLPALRPLGTWPSLLLSGALWGLWHAPVILLGYNFGQPNLGGLGLMVVGCTFYGVLVGWLRIRSGSIWPSVLAHGAFNAAAGVALLVCRVNQVGDPVATGPLGYMSWILMGLLALGLAIARQLPRRWN